MRELERIRAESDDLKSKLQAIEMSLGGIQASTDRSVALLVELDRVKRNMEACATALQQTERFLALSKSIESGLAQGQDFAVIVGQIREVRASLDVLQNVPEFRNATTRLAQYEKRLEVHVRPKFVAAVRANDVSTALELCAVYRDIEQESVMKKAYFETRREDLSTFVTSQTSEPLETWLPLFYDRLLTVVTAESEWCQLLFGSERKRSTQGELAAYLLDFFSSALASRMEGLSLEAATELHRHAAKVRPHLDMGAFGALEKPFHQYVKGYGLLEKDWLMAQLKKNSHADVYSLAEAAVDRCQSLTGFDQLEGLVGALETVFAASFKSASGSKLGALSSSSPSSSSSPAQQTDVQQWNRVHTALKSLAGAKAAHRKLRAFDSRLRARVVAVDASVAFAADPLLPVLPLADEAARKRIEEARAVVFDAIFGVVRTALEGMSRLPLWTRSETGVDADMPKLRPDASQHVTRVIEHLFALPHHLENLDDEEDGAEHWINLVAKAAVDLYAKEVQAIPKMSGTGRVQLQTDLDAMGNLLSALGVASNKLSELKPKK